MMRDDEDHFEDQNRDFVARAKGALDRAEESMDPAILARLRQARLRALESSPRRLPRFVWAGGLASATVGVLVAALWLTQPAVLSPAPPLEDIDILASTEDLEFYDDLDFYYWLADADVAS